MRISRTINDAATVCSPSERLAKFPVDVAFSRGPQALKIPALAGKRR
jgi:hypothetical protein